jgi:hypothetical protein
MNITDKIIILRNTIRQFRNNYSSATTGELLLGHLTKLMDDLFPEKIFSKETESLKVLLDKYVVFAERSRCPLCGAGLLWMKNYQGCSNFPTCKGARTHNGSPSLNDAMREFLADKLSEEGLDTNLANDRFKTIDI